MKYFRFDYVTEERKEISPEKAHDILLTTWKDTEMTRDMLTIPNSIICRFSRVDVESDDGMVSMPGLFNLIPDGAEYDEKGNRITA